MNYPKRAKRIVIVLTSLFAALIISFLILPRVLVIFMPFIIGYFLAKIVEPVVLFLTCRIKIPRKISGALTVIFIIGTLIFLLIFIVWRIFSEFKYLVSQSEYISEQIAIFFENIKNFIYGITGGKTSSLFGMQVDFSTVRKQISAYINNNIGPVIEKTFILLTKLPSALIFITVLIFSTYFISVDREKITSSIKKCIPKRIFFFLSNVISRIKTAFSGYLKAQFSLSIITLGICTFAFLIIGGNTAKYALLLGVIISFIDIVPVLGTGTILIPWSIYSFMSQNTKQGLILLLLYIVCLAVRQVLEPKFVGKNIGLHPLLTLMSMYAGLNILGFFGILLGPVIILVIKNMADSGLFSFIAQYISGGKTNEKI